MPSVRSAVAGDAEAGGAASAAPASTRIRHSSMPSRVDAQTLRLEPRAGLARAQHAAPERHVRRRGPPPHPRASRPRWRARRDRRAEGPCRGRAPPPPRRRATAPRWRPRPSPPAASIRSRRAGLRARRTRRGPARRATSARAPRARSTSSAATRVSVSFDSTTTPLTPLSTRQSARRSTAMLQPRAALAARQLEPPRGRRRDRGGRRRPGLTRRPRRASPTASSPPRPSGRGRASATSSGRGRRTSPR